MDTPNLVASFTITALILIPSLMAAWPILLSRMQDEYPERVKNGDLLFMLFSPLLDKRGIAKKTPPPKIMEQSMTIGLRPMVDRIVNPVITPVRIVQDVIADTLQTITVAIQDGITFPMRGMYELGTRLTTSLHKAFVGMAGSITGVVRAIHNTLSNLISGVLVALHMQATSFNLAVSGIKFFLWIVEMGGIAVIVAGGLMMLSLFTIIPGIVLITLGGILTGIAVESENVLRIA